MKTMSESAPDGAWHTASAQSEVAEILKGRWDSPKHQAQGRRKETRSGQEHCAGGFPSHRKRTESPG